VSDLQLAAGDNVSSQNIQRCDLNFADALGVVETQGLSLLAGGCPVVVDEQYMAEEGFHNPPQAYTLTAVATGTGEGPFTAGEITWYLVQEWRDAQGNLHQGPPSNSSRVTTTGPLPNINGLGTKFLAPTQKGRPFGVWYRTEAGSAGPAYRAERADGTIITDDSELIQGDPIYTTGASGEELPNEPAPAFRQGCAWQNRVWLAGCDDGRSIFFSKALEEGTATRFNRQLVRRVPADWGRVVGVAPLDNRLLIIAEYAIGSIYGSGPNNLGEQDAYSDPEPLDKSIGGNWAAPLSIIETSDGVWFQSRQGLRLVTRGGAVARGDDGVYMGTEVDGYNDTTLPFTASLRPDKMQVIFSRASRTLVYDQTWRQWSTWTAGSAASHTAGGVWYAATGSTLYARSASATQLNGANFNTTFRTGWVSMAGIAGSKRLRRLQIVMHDPARAAGTQTGTLTIRQNFDGLTAVSTMVITFTPNAAGIAQIEHHFATQYCESVQIEFSFRPTAASSARLRLAALSLEVGMKPGSWRLADTQRF
jgi:hypothetical protein